MAAITAGRGSIGTFHGLHPDRRRPDVVGQLPPEDSAARRRALKAEGPVRPRHGDAGRQQRAAGAVDRDRRRYSEQRTHRRRPSQAVAQGVKRGEGIAGPLRKRRRIPAAGRTPAGAWAKRRAGWTRCLPAWRTFTKLNARRHPALHVIVRAASDSGHGHHGRRVDSEHAARDHQHQRRGDMRQYEQNFRRRKTQAGVTLIEMLVVVTIIALFAALVVPKHVPEGRRRRRSPRPRRRFNGFHDRARRIQARHQHVPDNRTGSGGTSRSRRTECRTWQGPYLPQEVPKDPWGNPYVYKYPGEHGDEPDIISYGADGKPGGEGINADIVSWK